jgi:hypothetical protein
MFIILPDLALEWEYSLSTALVISSHVILPIAIFANSRMAELQFAQGDREKSLKRLESVIKKDTLDPTLPLIIQICNMSLSSQLLEVSPFSYSSHLVRALGVAASHYLAPVRYRIVLQIAEHQVIAFWDNSDG